MNQQSWPCAFQHGAMENKEASHLQLQAVLADAVHRRRTANLAHRECDLPTIFRITGPAIASLPRLVPALLKESYVFRDQSFTAIPFRCCQPIEKSFSRLRTHRSSVKIRPTANPYS